MLDKNSRLHLLRIVKEKFLVLHNIFLKINI